MSVIPTSKPEFLQFCTDHDSAWTSNAVAIGLTAGQVAAWKALYGNAQSSFNKAMAARDAARAMTLSAETDLRAARAATAELVRLIKNKAVATSNPNIYALGQIPPPADPSAVPAPGQPFMVRADLQPGGALEITWKCDNPEGASGTFYQVKRRLGSSGPFAIIGGAGREKRTVDGTIPAGGGPGGVVQYTVQAQRGALSGLPSETFTVNFGIGGDGTAFIASMSGGGAESGAGMKMAA